MPALLSKERDVHPVTAVGAGIASGGRTVEVCRVQGDFMEESALVYVISGSRMLIGRKAMFDKKHAIISNSKVFRRV